MAWTDEETRRIQTLENAVADLRRAINNLAAKRQLNHVLALTTQEISDLETRIDDLESQLAALQK